MFNYTDEKNGIIRKGWTQTSPKCSN